MGAVLTGFGGWLLEKFGSQLFKRASIFITMNIILQFLSQWILSQVVQGISLNSGGGSVTTLLSSITPMVLYIFDVLWVVPGVFLVFNVMLWRLSGRLTIRAATAGS